MARFAQLLLNGNFASAFTRYMDHYPGQESHARIVVPIRLENMRHPVLAVVDTGSPWCVLDPEIARQVGVSGQAEYISKEPIEIRGYKFQGKLVRMGISLEVEEGKNLEIDATVFVPTLLAGEQWRHPNFIGLTGFLERIRFAIDPEENVFYFGPVE